MAQEMARTVKGARNALVGALAALGPLRPAHAQVFEHLDPDGTRPTVLAQRAGMTHQAMSELVGELVAAGLLERVADPDDGRARLVRPTPAGRAELERAAAALAAIRAEWQRRLGPDLRVPAVLAALRTLIDVCEARYSE
jgi:DNA-binding MarR family transcriptional regulator